MVCGNGHVRDGEAHKCVEIACKKDQSAVAAFKDYSGEGVLQWFCGGGHVRDGEAHKCVEITCEEVQSAVAAFKGYSGEGVLQWFVAVAMCVMVKHINMLRVPVKRYSQSWLPSKTTQEKVCCSGLWRWPCA